MAIDLSKFRTDIEKEFKRQASDIIKKISASDKSEIGEGVISEMLELIKKGVSPIANANRFPAYKWVGKANTVRKVAKNLKGDRKKRANQKAADLKKGKYPYSVQGKFPGKRERPVNLYLSGEFLDDLKSKATAIGLEIGFFTDLSAKKESGHREGVNDQPRRPIIPAGKEQFSPSIYRRLLKLVQSVINRKIGT